MNGKSEPLSEADIIAARYRAAEGGVPWDRAKALSEAMAKAEAKALERLAAKRKRRNRLALMGLSLLTALALLAWLLTRSR